MGPRTPSPGVGRQVEGSPSREGVPRFFGVKHQQFVGPLFQASSNLRSKSFKEALTPPPVQPSSDCHPSSLSFFNQRAGLQKFGVRARRIQCEGSLQAPLRHTGGRAGCRWPLMATAAPDCCVGTAPLLPSSHARVLLLSLHFCCSFLAAGQ